MPDGEGDYKIGSAYVEVHLRDETKDDEKGIRDKVKNQDPVTIPTKFEDPDPGPLKDKYKKIPPVEVPVQAQDPIDDAWRQKLRSSVKSTVLESLKVPLDPESEKFRIELSETMKSLEKSVSAKIPADLSKRVEFKSEVELLARTAADGVKAKIPVEVDEDKAQSALRHLTSSVDSTTKDAGAKFDGMVSGVGLAWTALGALVGGPILAAGVAAAAGAFAAVGIAAERQVPAVQQAFATMKTEGIDAFKNGFQSLTPAIVASMNAVTDGARAATPQLAQLSAAIGPGLQVFTRSLVQAASEALPQFVQVLQNATPMAQAFGNGIVELSRGFGQLFTHIDFSQAETGLQALFSAVGHLLPVVGQLVNAVMPFANALLTSVIPAATSTASVLIGAVAPALHAVGSAIGALAPVLNFMSGPTASVLLGVVAFKSLSAATNGLLPIFNTVSTGFSSVANRAMSMVGVTDKSAGSFTLLTSAAKQQAVQAAETALVTAQQAATQQAANLATVESAAVNGAASITEEQLAAARATATAATEAEAEATAALAAANRTSSFAFGPVGIGLAVVAGAMALFSGNTEKATPDVQNFTSELNQLSQASPAAATGILAANPAFAKFVKGANDAGVSVTDLTAAMNGNGEAQDKVAARMQSSIDAYARQSITVQGTTSDLTRSIAEWASADPKFDDTLAPEVSAAVKQLRGMQGALGDLKGQFGATNQAQNTARDATQLTTLQQQAAGEVARKYGLSVDDVSHAFAKLPGAGSGAADAVMKVTSAFDDGRVKMLNAEQTVSDYYKGLAKSAEQANQSVTSAQHAYAQSVTAVSDAEHSAAQASMAVTTAREGVAAATRAVADAEHSYTDAQHSQAQAQQGLLDAEAGVVIAEDNVAKAQDAERQAQVSLTQARAQAVEQLKALHLQLNDQVTAEQRAQIAVFDQTATSKSLGVTKDNAAAILAQPLTAQNEALQKSALDLVSAENSLADSMNTGANLRKQVAQADQAGVEGSQQVVTAQRAVKSAQDQVVSSQQALVKSHQQVTQAVYALDDANYSLRKAQQAIVDSQAGVVKAQQAVKDAVYAEQKSRQAVTDAIFNEHQQLLALRDAQDAARQANDLNTHSLDLNTQAGRNNWAQLQTLFGSYPQWMTDQQKYNQMVNDTASAFNGSKQAAFDFLQQEGKIPKTYTFDVAGAVTMDMTPLANWANDKSGYFAGGFRSAGGAVAMAEGGHVKGPGGPTDDVIDAKLSNNEFVQPASVVDHYGVAYMEALRQKKIPKFAKGGLVDPVSLNLLAGGWGVGYEFMRNTEILAGRDPGAIPQIPAPVPRSSYSGSGPGGGGPIPTGQHLAMIDAALAADGIPAADWARWEAGLNVLIGRESSWNPNIVNNWDSNAKAGHPSGGLMQTIGPTFESNRNHSLPDNMFDPVANIAAGVNYIRNRYGDISNVQQANPNLPAKGYALGDIVGTDGASLLGKMAPNAQIIPRDSKRIVGDNKKVPESYIPHEPSDPRAQQILSETNLRMGRGGSKPVVNVTINTAESDPERIASMVSSRIGWAMRGV